jgi:hypothetical protein
VFTLALHPGATPADPPTVRVSPGTGYEDVDIAVFAAGQELAPEPDGTFAIDPYAHAPGPLAVRVEATSDGTLIAGHIDSVEIPVLTPAVEISEFGSDRLEGQHITATGQPGTTLAWSTEGGRRLAVTGSDGRATFLLPDGQGDLIVDVLGPDGSPVQSATITGSDPPDIPAFPGALLLIGGLALVAAVTHQRWWPAMLDRLGAPGVSRSAMAIFVAGAVMLAAALVAGGSAAAVGLAIALLVWLPAGVMMYGWGSRELRLVLPALAFAAAVAAATLGAGLGVTDAWLPVAAGLLAPATLVGVGRARGRRTPEAGHGG